MATVPGSRFAYAFELSAQAMFMATLDGRLLAVNQAMRSLIGRSGGAQPMPQTLPELLVQPARFADLLGPLRAQGRVADLDVVFARGVGTPVTLRISGTRLPDDESDTFTATAVLPAPTPAEHGATSISDGLRAFERMTSTLAHDLNNVLSAMNGYCYVLRDSIAGNVQALDDLAGVEEASERVTAIVRQLTAIGQRQLLHPVRLDPARQIESRQAVLRRLLPQGVDLQITSVRAGREISIDPGVFDEIISILAMNARKSMPDGGWLHVRTATAPNDREVFIDVMDTGASKRAFILDTAYDPFSASDAPGPYSALALAAVRALIVRSGGRITAESAPGFGTTFRVTFPLVERLDIAAPTPATRATAAPRANGGRIFVVDDDGALRLLTERVLTLQGYEIIQGRSGEEALSLLDEMERPVDVLLTDLMMPGVKGWEVGRAVRQRFPECAVIYMSGYNDARIRHELSDDSLFLSKPFTPPRLAAIVAEALTQRLTAPAR